MVAMKQAKLAFDPIAKKTRRRVFLDEMEQVVPWGELVALVEPHAPKADSARGGRPPFAVSAMPRVHFLQQWFGLGDLAMEEALHDTPMPSLKAPGSSRHSSVGCMRARHHIALPSTALPAAPQAPATPAMWACPSPHL